MTNSSRTPQSFQASFCNLSFYFELTTNSILTFAFSVSIFRYHQNQQIVEIRRGDYYLRNLKLMYGKWVHS